MDDELYSDPAEAAPAAAGPASVELQACQRALRAWEDTFQDDPCCAGAAPVPARVLDALLELRGSERAAVEALKDAQRRTTALLARCDASDATAAELRCALAAVSPSPDAVAVRELVLDPAAVAELGRLGRALEAAKEALKGKEEEVTALSFSKESKQGRLLMARMKVLQTENAEMGAAVEEGRLQALETEIAVLRHAVTALKTALAEAKDTAELLASENEALQLHVLGREGLGAVVAAQAARTEGAEDEAPPAKRTRGEAVVAEAA